MKPFALELSGKRRILLRTTFTYLRFGADDPTAAELDVLLPKLPNPKE